jgi:hypothetical protein
MNDETTPQIYCLSDDEIVTVEHNNTQDITTSQENDNSDNKNDNDELEENSTNEIYNTDTEILALYDNITDFLLPEDINFFHTQMLNFCTRFKPCVETLILYLNLIIKDSISPTNKILISNVKERYDKSYLQLRMVYNTIIKWFQFKLDIKVEDETNNIDPFAQIIKYHNTTDKLRSYFLSTHILKLNKDEEHYNKLELSNRTLVLIHKNKCDLHKLYFYENDQFFESNYTNNHNPKAWLQHLNFTTNCNQYKNDFNKINRDNNFENLNKEFKKKFKPIEEKYRKFKKEIGILLKNLEIDIIDYIKNDLKKNDSPREKLDDFTEWDYYLKGVSDVWETLYIEIQKKYDDYLIHLRKVNSENQKFLDFYKISKTSDVFQFDIKKTSCSVLTNYNDRPISTKHEVGLSQSKNKDEHAIEQKKCNICGQYTCVCVSMAFAIMGLVIIFGIRYIKR